MKISYQLLCSVILIISASCGNDESVQNFNTSLEAAKLNYLALGDSYTIGQSVCSNCSFPEQLRDSLNTNLEEQVALRTIAVTGWTTSDLLNALTGYLPEKNFDLVTLLIGVNNQFQEIPFSVYVTEFEQLLNEAILLAGNDPSKVIVLSIPDYAYTPYGENRPNFNEISQEIDQYNDLARTITITSGAAFEDITSISRQGLTNTSLISSDGLHLSAEGYSLFVDKIYTSAQRILRAVD